MRARPPKVIGPLRRHAGLQVASTIHFRVEWGDAHREPGRFWSSLAWEPLPCSLPARASVLTALAARPTAATARAILIERRIFGVVAGSGMKFKVGFGSVDRKFDVVVAGCM